jgi:alpha-galactosidase
MGVNALAFRIPQHNALFAVNADCVGVTPQIPWEQNRQWLDLLARSGTPLFVSVDPQSLDAGVEADLRQALGRAAEEQPLGEPLDWMDNTLPVSWRFGAERVEYDWF